MTNRQRAADQAVEEARRASTMAGMEFQTTRLGLGLSLVTVARAAAMSRSQLGRIERGQVRRPTLDQLFRVARALGLAGSLRFFPAGSPVRDAGQLALMGRLARLLAQPLALRREVCLPLAGDLRAWDGMIVGGEEGAFVEGESHVGDTQSMARRMALKQRDDPRAKVVILLLARSAHNRQVLAEHREALRAQFPLDGGAIARALRAGKVPSASGIIML